MATQSRVRPVYDASAGPIADHRRLAFGWEGILGVLAKVARSVVP